MNQATRIARSTRADRTKKKIYEAGRELFNRDGFDNVSVDAIVERAAVAKGTFYVHYPTKDVLIAEVVSELVDQLDIGYQAHIDALPEGTKAVDLLYALVEKIVEAMSVAIGHDIIRMVYIAQLTQTVDIENVSGYNRGLYGTLRNILVRGVETCEFRADLDIDLLAGHCVLFMRGLLYEWCARSPAFDLGAHAERHFNLLLQGFACR